MERVSTYSSLKGRALLFLGFLWFIWFMNFSVRTIFSPILPLIEDDFMITHARATSLFFYSSTGYSISLFLSGLFSGYVGYRRSVSVSLFISAVLFLLVPFSRQFSHLLALVFMLGLTTGIYLPAVIPLMTHYYEGGLWGRVIATHDSAASMSIFATPFIAVGLLSFLDWRSMFYVLSGIFAILSILFRIISDEVRVSRSVPGQLPMVIRSPSLWLMGAAWVFAAGANLGIYFVTPLYLTKELMLDINYANEIFGFSRIGGVVLTIAMGFLIDRFSLRGLMFIQLLLTGIVTLLIPTAGAGHIGWVLFLQATTVMGYFPVGLVAISRVFPVEQRSLATGIVTTLGVLFGLGFIPYFLGLCGDILGFGTGIRILGACVILSSVLTLFIRIGQSPLKHSPNH